MDNTTNTPSTGADTTSTENTSEQTPAQAAA